MDAARVDFSSILEPFWEALALRFSFVGVLERGSNFHDFPVLSRSLSRAVFEADNGVSGALQPSLLKDSKLKNTTTVHPLMKKCIDTKNEERKMQNNLRSLLPLTRRGRRILIPFIYNCFQIGFIYPPGPPCEGQQAAVFVLHLSFFVFCICVFLHQWMYS